MVSLNVTIKDGKNRKHKAMVELDADKFEKLAGIFGLFNPDFLKSLARSEKDYREGKFFKIKSLKDLEK